MKIGSKGVTAVIAVIVAIGYLTSVAPQVPLLSHPVQPSMVLIKGGTFEMGQAAEDLPKIQEMFKIKRAEIFAAEAPRHRVKLSSFFIDKYEVTNAEFQKFIEGMRNGKRTKFQPNFITEITFRIGTAPNFLAVKPTTRQLSSVGMPLLPFAGPRALAFRPRPNGNLQPAVEGRAGRFRGAIKCLIKRW